MLCVGPSRTAVQGRLFPRAGLVTRGHRTTLTDAAVIQTVYHSSVAWLDFYMTIHTTCFPRLPSACSSTEDEMGLAWVRGPCTLEVPMMYAVSRVVAGHLSTCPDCVLVHLRQGATSSATSWAGGTANICRWIRAYRPVYLSVLSLGVGESTATYMSSAKSPLCCAPLS